VASRAVANCKKNRKRTHLISQTSYWQSHNISCEQTPDLTCYSNCAFMVKASIRTKLVTHANFREDGLQEFLESRGEFGNHLLTWVVALTTLSTGALETCFNRGKVKLKTQVLSRWFSPQPLKSCCLLISGKDQLTPWPGLDPLTRPSRAPDGRSDWNAVLFLVSQDCAVNQSNLQYSHMQSSFRAKLSLAVHYLASLAAFLPVSRTDRLPLWRLLEGAARPAAPAPKLL